MTPILATTLLLALVGSMSEFLIGSIFLTDDSQKSLAVGMYGMFASDRSNNLGIFAAGSVMIMVPVIVVYQFLERCIVGGSTAGAASGGCTGGRSRSRGAGGAACRPLAHAR